MALSLPVLCVASIESSRGRMPEKQSATLIAGEAGFWKTALRTSRFSDVPQAAGHSRCKISRVPEALTTPDPVLDNPDLQRVTISFIVGTDGRVHSAYILESGGAKEDRAVLQTIRAWRYRPAMCNGVPIEAEGRIQFSIQ